MMMKKTMKVLPRPWKKDRWTTSIIQLLHLRIVNHIRVAAWTELIWKKRNLQYSKERIRFTGNTDHSPPLETPLQFFSEFINEDILTVIVEQINLYVTPKNVSNCPPVTATEIHQFLGIFIFMFLYHYSNVRSYWCKYGFDHIRHTMTVNRFEKIRSVIHFNDNAQHKPVGHPNMIVFIK